MRPEDSAFDRTASIVLRGDIIRLDRPLVMGILNLDPDSFYAGSRAQGVADAVARVQQMINEGMDILDIGAASSRPGAPVMDPEAEWKRLEEFLVAIRQTFPQLYLSIDTPHWLVAQRSILAGGDLINDISGGAWDPEMIPGMGRSGIPYIGMHMKGSPETMQHLAQYNSVLTEVISYFTEKLAAYRSAGIKDVILDPGFGFAKNSAHNFALLEGLSHIKSLSCPLLVGLSRKRMIYGNLGISAADALNGTTALHMAALERGADILRVHDVKEAVECVKLFLLLKGSE